MENYEKAEQDYMGGMKYKDIAEKYGTTINTVKSWKKRYGWNREKMVQTNDLVGIGVVQPNTLGFLFLHAYNLVSYNGSGLPEYSNGIYFTIGDVSNANNISRFGTFGGIYYYKEI